MEKTKISTDFNFSAQVKKLAILYDSFLFKYEYSKIANYTEKKLQHYYDGINYWINLTLNYIFLLPYVLLLLLRRISSGIC